MGSPSPEALTRRSMERFSASHFVYGRYYRFAGFRVNSAVNQVAATLQVEPQAQSQHGVTAAFEVTDLDILDSKDHSTQNHQNGDQCQRTSLPTQRRHLSLGWRLSAPVPLLYW